MEVNPPVEAWVTISEGVDNRSGRRWMPVFLRFAAAFAAFVVAAFSLWFFVFEDVGNDAAVASQSVPAPMEPVAIFNTVDLPDLSTVLSETSLDVIQPINTIDVLADQTVPVVVAQTSTLRMLQPVFPAQLKTKINIDLSDPATQQESLAMLLPEEDYSELSVLSYHKPGKASNFSLGAHFAPQYNYRHLADNSSSIYAEIPFSSLESQILTFSAGLSVFYRISPDWIIQTGLNYNNMGQFVKDIHAYHHVNNLPLYYQSQQIITSMGNIMINDPYHHFDDVRSSRVSSKQTLDNHDIKSLHKSGDGLTQVFRFAEVPLLIRYQLYNKHAGLQIKGGFAASYLLQKDVYMGTDLMQSPIGETYGIETYNLSFVGGFAINIPVFGGMNLHMEPTIQYFIQPFVHEGNRASVLPYSFSLQTGISYRF